jgi:cobalamin biosynthesis protein CobT
MQINQRVLVMREAITKIVPMLSAQSVVVTLRGMRAFVEYDQVTLKPKRVNLPYLPDDCSDELLDAVQGFLDHEVGHILFTDEKSIPASVALGREIDRMTNAVEDPFVERKMQERFTGTAANLAHTHAFFLNRMIAPQVQQAVDSGDKKMLAAVLMTPAIRALAGQGDYINFMKGFPGHLEKLRAVLGEDVCAEIPRVQSSWDCIELAKKIVQRMKDAEPPPPPPAPPQPPESDDSDADRGEEQDPGQDGENGDQQEQPQDADQDPEDEEGQGGESEPQDEDDAEEQEGEGPGEPEDDAEEQEGEQDPEDAEGEGEGQGSPDEEGGQEPDAGESDAEGDEGQGEPQADGEDDAEEGDEQGGQGQGEEGDEQDDPDATGEDQAGEGDGASSASDAGEPGEDAGEAQGDAQGEQSEEDADAGEGEPDTGNLRPDMNGEFRADLQAALADMQDFDEALAQALTERATQEAKTSEYLVFSRDDDLIEPLPVTEDGVRKIPAMQDTMDGMLGLLQKDLERAIAARSAAVWTGGFRSGRLDGASLVRLKFGQDNVFARKQENKTKDVAVEVVLDLSGSMTTRNKLLTACYSAYAISSVLERLQIKHEVIGFTTRPMSPEVTAELQADPKMNDYARFEALYLPIFKGWDERLGTEQKARFAQVPTMRELCMDNVDGESVQIAARRLALRKEARKVLMVLSDGQPAVVGYGDVNLHLRTVVQDIERSGIDVVGIGICDQSVRQFYKRAVVMNNVTDLPKTVMQELKAMLMK